MRAKSSDVAEETSLIFSVCKYRNLICLLSFAVLMAQGCAVSQSAQNHDAGSGPTQAACTVSASPAGLSATAGNAQVSLTWASVSGAASYDIHRGTTSGGPYRVIATGISATTYSDMGLTDGTTYYYVVTALNSCGESANSNQASATPEARAPSIVSLSPASAPVGTSVTITGQNFGSPQGTSSVTFNGMTATPTSWSSTTIVAPVPKGATSGNVVVTVSGVASNGVSFVVNTFFSATALGAHSATDNGTSSSNIVVVNITPQAAGSTLFCWTKFVNGSAFLSVSDNVNGGTYQVYNSRMRDNAHNYIIGSYYHENVAAAPTTVTLAYSPAGAHSQMACAEIQHTPASYAMDGNFVASIATTSTDPNSGTALTPTGEGEMILSSTQMDSGLPAAGTNYTLLDSQDTYAHEYWAQSTATPTAGNFTDASLVGYAAMMAAVSPNVGGFCDATQVISWTGGIEGKTPAIADLQAGTFGGAAQPNIDLLNNPPGWTLVNLASGVSYVAPAYQPFATNIACPFYSGRGNGSLGVSRDTSIPSGGGVSYHFDTTQTKVTVRSCISTPDIPNNIMGYMDTLMLGGGDNSGNFDYANVVLTGDGVGLFFDSEFKGGSVSSPPIPVTSGNHYGVLITYNQAGLHTISFYNGCGSEAPLIGTQTAPGAIVGGGPADFVGFFSGTAMSFPSGYHVYMGAAKLDILYGGAISW